MLKWNAVFLEPSTRLRDGLGSRKYFSIYKRFKRWTMIPPHIYVMNLRLGKSISHLDGCIVECGVWRGGMSAGFGYIMPHRRYWLFDSFEGLPEAKEIDGQSALAYQANTESKIYYDNCRAEQAEAEQAMGMSRAKDVRIVKGWFDDTLPNFPDHDRIALLRLDGDWYESTIACLRNLYPKVVRGGMIIIDDYYTWDGCSRAVHDFLSEYKLSDRVRQFEDTVAYIVKS